MEFGIQIVSIWFRTHQEAAQFFLESEFCRGNLLCTYSGNAKASTLHHIFYFLLGFGADHLLSCEPIIQRWACCTEAGQEGNHQGERQ
jgi:hypothetical protein